MLLTQTTPIFQKRLSTPPVLPRPIPLTKTSSSWILHIPGFCKSPNRRIFEDVFDQHPNEYHPIYIFGKQTFENRYSQMYVTDANVGALYKYSGTSKKCIICRNRNGVGSRKDKEKEEGGTTTDTATSTNTHTNSTTTGSTGTFASNGEVLEQIVIDLCHIADELLVALENSNLLQIPDEGYKHKVVPDDQKAKEGRNTARHNTGKSIANVQENDVTIDSTNEGSETTSTTTTRASSSSSLFSWYNSCLMNWYLPKHSIGLHADDEREMDNRYPIISLSWGGPRRFLLRPKKNTLDYNKKVTEILIRDGDLLVMGGKCQEEFKHEIPKLRKCDGLVSERISWTIRRMVSKNKPSKQQQQRQQQQRSLSTNTNTTRTKINQPTLARTSTTSNAGSPQPTITRMRNNPYKWQRIS